MPRSGTMKGTADQSNPVLPVLLPRNMSRTAQSPAGAQKRRGESCSGRKSTRDGSCDGRPLTAISSCPESTHVETDPTSEPNEVFQRTRGRRDAALMGGIWERWLMRRSRRHGESLREGKTRSKGNEDKHGIQNGHSCVYSCPRGPFEVFPYAVSTHTETRRRGLLSWKRAGSADVALYRSEIRPRR